MTDVYDAKITDNLPLGAEARRYYGGDIVWRTVAKVEDIGTAGIGWNKRRVTFTNGETERVSKHTRWEVRTDA